METNDIKKILSELITEAAKGLKGTRTDPSLPNLTKALIAAAKRSFPIMHSIAILADDDFSGDAILLLSDKIYDYMFSIEQMTILEKDQLPEGRTPSKFSAKIEEILKEKKANDEEAKKSLQEYTLGDTNISIPIHVQSPKTGINIAIVSYISILHSYAEETGNKDLEAQMDKLFNKLSIS